jgi:suppressor for copper-sensitivity B
MPASCRSQFWIVALALAIVAPLSSRANAQLNILDGGPLAPAGQLGSIGLGGPESLVTVRAQFSGPAGGRPAMLSITAHIAPPWYTYSTTQKPVAATPTRITLDASDDFRLSGEFRSNLPPTIVHDQNLVFEEFASDVTWQAPIDIRPGVDVANLKILGRARIQVCMQGRCLNPTEFPFLAAFVPSDAVAGGGAAGVYNHPNIHATIRGHLEPQTARPGSTVNLVLTAEPAKDWHIYGLAASDSGSVGYKPTLIALSNSSGFQAQATKASEPPLEFRPTVPSEPMQRYHTGSVTWTTPIEIPANTKPGSYPIEGVIGYQTCSGTRCDAPRAARFASTISVAAKAKDGSAPLAFSDAKYFEAAQLAAARPTPVEVDAEPAGLSTLPMILLASLLGGFILNFMPCVLPVIGLKILSFAEQAGRSRAQILALNVWYALGTLSVFLVLATLASGVNLGLREQNLGWGEQFSSTAFNVVMVAVVFVMALSFLGVWEIPIPGFVGSGAATEIAAREGAAGAFAKGVLTTVLATPCSGPALGPVFGYTLNQPPEVTYLVFGCIGLGMSAPYLVIGAFPRLIRYLPKPGAWMDTFKHMMGFVMLATIVFLFGIIKKDYLVPTFAMMVGLWAACWWIGRTSLVETLARKLKAWAQGAAFAGVVTLCAFIWLVPQTSIIPWQKFSQAELAKLTGEGQTVLVDFTADWCLTCKSNLFFAIETKEVRDALAKNKVVPLLADFTDAPPEIKTMLETLHSASIPVLAVFPAGDPLKPIVLRDIITKKMVLNAIKEAAASKDDSKSLTVVRP